MRRPRLLASALVLVLYGCLLLVWRNHDGRQESKLIKDAVDTFLDDWVSDLLLSVQPQHPSESLAGTFDLQSRLSCMISQGEWKNSPSGPLFMPQKDCFEFAQPADSNSSLEICRSLAGKKVLFVGPETTYHLHSLWLSSLETHENRSHTCFGQEYCTFHHICRPPSDSDDDAVELVGRKKKVPNNGQLLATRSALLQYTFSSTLHAAEDPQDTAYNVPVIDQQSGVRSSNTYWLRRASKAHFVVMNRGPDAAPASTYDWHTPSGNWSFAEHLCETEAMDTDFCSKSLLHRLSFAALYITINDVLPSIVRTIQQLQDFDYRAPTFIWQGSWYVQPRCASRKLPRSVPLLPAFWFDGQRQAKMDPWSFFYNTQVYMHDQILPRLLPYFNITYIPLTMPFYDDSWSVLSGLDSKYSSSHAKDCIRNPWPNFGRDGVERAFFDALSTVISHP